MDKLSKKEEELLLLIKKKPGLQPLFFGKVKGLKWFYPLQKEGYFEPENLPPPAPSERKGYITIPLWGTADYLMKTAPRLDKEEDELYHQEFLSIIENTTKYAKENKFNNYQVWWRFAEILFYIPHKLMSEKTIDAVDYWLQDEHGSDLVAEVIGEKLLPKILNKRDNRATDIACGFLSKLFQLSFKPHPLAISETEKKAYLRFDDYWAKRIIKAIASKTGERLGRKGVSIFHGELTRVLKKLNNDRWSSNWQPAIEDHEQNSFHDDAENLLVLAYRDSLKGFIQSSPKEAKKYLYEILDSKYETIQRIAIYHIGQKQKTYKESWNHIINKKFFQLNFLHEIWHFLNLNYKLFTDKQKEETLQIIREKVQKDENKNILKEASAYLRIHWLKAIKDHGEYEKKFYQSEAKTAGAEPKHPDFSIYMIVGGGGIIPTSSPHTKDELNGMKISDLVKTLKSSKDNGLWGTPDSGLSQTFKDAIASDPLRYIKHLDKFKDLDLPYVCSIIVGYSERWREKAELPWDDIWLHLLDYVSNVIKQKNFWDIDAIDTANRNYLVIAISRMIEEGAQSDDHAFDEKHHGKVKDILKCLLENQKSDTFNENNSFDALTIAINSPRGKCVEALIKVALRHCRLADKKNDGNHAEAWEELQSYFDTELKRESNVNYEFFSLIPIYIHNFLYMSEKWLTKNLENIFDKNDNKKWTCAIHGYAYLNRFVIEIYQHLKSHGHIIRALNDKGLPRKCSIRFVQNAVRSFLANKERLDDEDSLIHILLSRGRSNEIHEIIRFICSFRSEDREKIIPKVYDLWPRIQKIIRDIGFSSGSGRNLVSPLCRWTEFLDRIDNKNKEWLLEIAPYAHSLPLARRFLENLARLSKQHPFEVNEILQAMISGASKHTYGFLGSNEQIKTILENLVNEGKEEGKHAAKETVNKFAAKGMFQPSKLLSEILNKTKPR